MFISDLTLLLSNKAFAKTIALVLRKLCFSNDVHFVLLNEKCCNICSRRTIDSNSPGGCSITFNTGGGALPIFGVQNQYLGSVNDNMDKNSSLWVHQSEKRKNF